MFGRPRETARNWLAVAGGVIPDLAIYVLYAIEKLKGTAESKIWGEIYFSDFWQDVVAVGNSIPLWVALALVAWLLRKRFPAVALLLGTFSGSCLLHMALDFPVHHDDAHRHFFPLSDFRFHSPVSYWDPNHYGGPFAIFEAILGIGLSVWLMRQYRNIAVRIATGFLLAGYLLVPAYFFWQLVGN